MRSRSLPEVRQLLSTDGFRAWWESLLRAREARDDARARSEELLTQGTLMEFRAELAQKTAIDTLDRAVECEDRAAKMTAEAQELENESFAAIAEFEELRFHASERWSRLCAAERRVDELQERLAQASTAAAAAAKREPDALVARLRADLKPAERALQEAAAAHERENEAKARQWEKVERLWERTAELTLLTAESHATGRKIHREAERLFQEAEDRKLRSRQLRDQAAEANRERAASDAALQQVLVEAREAFGCASGESFLYFRQAGDQRRALCVSLIDDTSHHNVEVRPLALYTVDRQQGVAFLEPAVDAKATDAEGDRRFEAYFLEDRKGPDAADGSEKSSESAG